MEFNTSPAGQAGDKDNSHVRHPSRHGHLGRGSRNLDFYTRALGLRFVKKTVNFDDPGTYHLYYGDEAAIPAPSSPSSLGACLARPGRSRPHAADSVPRAGALDRLLDASPDRERA
jgi:catechol 2,3-dioxygenase-like lactoylglutathione lyase family enzyme